MKDFDTADFLKLRRPQANWYIEGKERKLCEYILNWMPQRKGKLEMHFANQGNKQI